jgi:hypothetical protein
MPSEPLGPLLCSWPPAEFLRRWFRFLLASGGESSGSPSQGGTNLTKKPSKPKKGKTHDKHSSSSGPLPSKPAAAADPYGTYPITWHSEWKTHGWMEELHSVTRNLIGCRKLSREILTCFSQHKLCRGWFVLNRNQGVSMSVCLHVLVRWHTTGLMIGAWGPFSLYSLDKIQLLRIMLSCFSQLEFPVVSGQLTISKYKSLVHMSSYIWYLFHVEPNLSLFHFHTFLSAI